MRQLINFLHPKTKKRCLGVRNIDTDRVITSSGDNYSLKYLENVDKEGVGFFETRQDGKVIQKTGKYKR